MEDFISPHIFVDAKKLGKSLSMLFMSLNLYCFCEGIKVPNILDSCGCDLSIYTENQKETIKDILKRWAEIPLDEKVEAYDKWEEIKKNYSKID